jgi:hypothetical protein
MTRIAALCATTLLAVAVPVAAQDQVLPADPAAAGSLGDSTDPRSAPQDFDLARKKVLECEGEQFVFAWGAGARPTKVTLCSEKNATPEKIVEMLDDAATKLEQTEGLAEDRRVAIVQQIRSKIAELQGNSSAAVTPEPEDPLRAARSGPAAVAVQPSRPAPRPSPSPATVAPLAQKPLSGPALPVLASKPRLTIGCSTGLRSGDAGQCVTIERNTLITVQANEALPSGAASLVFLRRGTPRGEVALAQMQKGSSYSLRLPRELCSGIMSSRVEIQLLSRNGGESAELIETLGPYPLRC